MAVVSLHTHTHLRNGGPGCSDSRRKAHLVCL